MDRMDDERHREQAGRIVAEYRSAFPDPDGERELHAELVAEDRSAARWRTSPCSGAWRKPASWRPRPLTLAMAVLIPRIQARARLHRHLRGCAGCGSLRGFGPIDG